MQQQMGGTKRQKELRKLLRQMLPRVPLADAQPILAGANARHLRHLPPSIALWQATTSHVRHGHTDYDTLLAEGYDRDAARFFVIEPMNAVLQGWGCARRVSPDDETDTPTGDQPER
ncbi:DUF2293 domain-containing protein [Stappia indica]|uniref:DUF2293 domain-containing protein n=1 Tax=Stappia indica TaxID=538381 RepID=UPI001CD680C5|nr:DUF2293 domain-containing protein [Stappia indica]MCA1299009.1 DUF2293 domain-containing protein [Stappia indica]